MAALDGPRLAPRSGGPAKKLVVLLHGYGADGSDLMPLADAIGEALPDVAFALPHGPAPCGGAPFGREWFPISFTDPSEFDRGADAARDLLERFIAGELAHHGLRDGDLALLGFSQGAMMALHVGLRRPAAPALVLGYSGLLPAPGRVAAETVRPAPHVVLVHGEFDDIVPPQAMLDAYNTLTAAGVPVDMHGRPGLGHGIDPEGAAIGIASLADAFSR